MNMSFLRVVGILQSKQSARAAITVLAFVLCTVAQAQKNLHNEVGVSYDGMQFDAHQQYLGYGIDYRHFFRSWIGVEAQGGVYPEWQENPNPDVAYQIYQIDGCVLLGRRWGRVGLFGEAGYGSFLALTYGGTTASGTAILPYRNYPDRLIGGIVDVSLQKRWSITYEVRDNRTSIGQYYEADLPPSNDVYPAEKLNIPEARIGVAFHF